MITTRAQNLTALIEKTHEIEQAVAQSESFKATTEAVQQLGDQLRAISEAYWRVADVLGPAVRADIRRTFEMSGEQLHQTRLQLRANPRQSNEIGRLGKQVAGAANRLETSWRRWSSEQIQPHRDALELVGFLPEIQEQRATIDDALERLNLLSQSFPTSDETLQTFYTTLDTLGAILGGVEGISESIRDFLKKVISGSATFQDLNQEILSWIQERGRAKAFRIEFRTTQGRPHK